MNVKNIKYVHEDHVHNFKAAEIAVPYIVKLLKPKSVVDVGCGIGTWLKVFQDYNIDKIIGIDGHYVDKQKLKIDESKFIEHDLEKEFSSDEKYDLAISLEVAEHLSVESASIFIISLSKLSDTIVFSAAIPHQGGQNHLNEQPPQFWIDIFEDLGFKLYDIFRPIFWDDNNIDAWYRQNMMLFTKDSSLFKELDLLDNFRGKHIVHPQLQHYKANDLIFLKNQVNRINEGKRNGRFYFRLIGKYLKRKLNKILILHL
ncbi:bifunctional 2-polyprenyl-6-hydroxyphenol methylase/3-demethylubiquinol 3-O-methyltransferase UbiG [Flavobacterium sp. ACN6]|uniref:class I SAM-dependent methyltransferase n=1 Tax=Flavobacterium sp. ACN6 TaxID=1920426 RepID=UPI000BB365E5|nr:methyltransferase domain-containing protein [Flavobacterium sp. ACN6]PBJ13854.1 hypothetical protein BSF42_13330 [Flavobacterium sp. ACN6]